MLYEIGSRLGALVAVVVFIAITGTLGWSVAREMRRRGISRRSSSATGSVLFVVPMLLVYFSSLAGFYELRVANGRFTATYLLPVFQRAVNATDVREIVARPAHRFQWRVRVTLESGERLTSALTSRRVAHDVAAELQKQLR